MKKLLLILIVSVGGLLAAEPPAGPIKADTVAIDPKAEEHTARVLAETRVKELEGEVATLTQQLRAQSDIANAFQVQRNKASADHLDAQAQAYLLQVALAAKSQATAKK